MDLGLQGKVALVAGASRGLGAAIALELAREGCSVGICARSAPALDAMVGRLSQFGRAWSRVTDLRASDDARAFVKEGVREFGRVDVLVTNAGGPPPGSLLDLDDAAWQGAFNLTLLSTIAMTREALPGMIARKWGRVLHVTSVSVRQPIDGLMLSNSLRMGVVGFAKTLSREVAPFGITVNSVCPGYTQTERVTELATSLARKEGLSVEQVVARWERDIPAGRIGKPDELAAVVAFLASERASYVNGATLQVDGGYIRGI